MYWNRGWFLCRTQQLTTQKEKVGDRRDRTKESIIRFLVSRYISFSSFCAKRHNPSLVTRAQAAKSLQGYICYVSICTCRRNDGKKKHKTIFGQKNFMIPIYPSPISYKNLPPPHPSLARKTKSIISQDLPWIQNMEKVRHHCCANEGGGPGGMSLSLSWLSS